MKAAAIDIARFKHWMNDHVRFSDLDPLGHVNNKAIASFFENERVAFYMEVLGGDPWKQKELFVLVHLSIDFMSELHLPAQIKIGSCVAKIGKSSVNLESLLTKNNLPVAHSTATLVYIDQVTRKPTVIPDTIRTKLSTFLSA